MGFNPFKIFKSLRISEAGTLTPKVIDIIPGGSASTTTTIQSSQTVDRTLTLPDETGTVLTTTSTIDLDQLEAVTANKALASDVSGHIVVSNVSDTELNFLTGVNSSIQTQLDTLTSNLSTTNTNLSTETSNRIAADALKANLNLNNILPTTNVDFNAQRLVNIADPVNPQDVATKAYVSSAGTGANTTLSNLTSPIAINQNLLPNSDASKNIGSATSRFEDGYFHGNVHAGEVHTDVIRTSASSTTSVNVGNRTLINTSGTAVVTWTGTEATVATPTTSTGIANKSYVDGFRNKSIKVYYTTTSSTIGGGFANIVPDTILWDDFGSSYNTSTGNFTVPLTGKYLVTTNLLSSATTLGNSTDSISARIFVNGASVTGSLAGIIRGTSNSQTHTIPLSDVVSVTAAQTISIAMTSTPNTTMQTGTSFTITYLGT